jgi:hypothetical protein
MKKRGRPEQVSDDNIRNIHERILAGESVKKVVEEFGISRQSYHLRKDELGLEIKRNNIENIIKNINKISDMHELAALLDITFNELHKELNPNKGVETNIKRMNYLKNKSPDKFQEAIINLIVNHYKITAIELIEILKNR